MNKRNVMIGIIALVALCGIAAGAITYDWGTDGGPQQVPFGLDGNGELPVNSINYQMFEVWGPVLLILGTLMFGAIIGGVCISKEEEKKKEGEE